MNHKDPLDDLTIVIPTYNRNYFLSRSLGYFKENGFKNIIVADSSSPEKQKVNEDTVKAIFGDEILYFWIPEKEYGSKVLEKTLSAIEKVRTPYATLCSDKDFPLLTGIQQCIRYLDENPDYHIADGKYYSFQVDYSSGIIHWRKAYTKKETIASESSIQRIENLIKKNYQPLSYSIHRTKTLYDTYSKVMDYTDDVRFGELFSGAYALTHGKYAYLNVDYWCRESNPMHSGSTQFLRMDDYLNDGTYSSKYRKFKDGLLTNISNDSFENSNNIIDSAMLTYLLRSYPERNGFKIKKYLKKFLMSIYNYLPANHKLIIKEYYARIHPDYKRTYIGKNEITPEIQNLTSFLLNILDNDAYKYNKPLSIERMNEMHCYGSKL